MPASLSGWATMADAVREKIPPRKRDEKLAADRYRCQTCPEESVAVGGEALVEVHHRNPDPADEEQRHEMPNLTTLCDGCHSWLHKKPDGANLPIEFSAADRRALKPYDYLILKKLCESGPCPMSEVVDALSILVSESAVRERMWRMMGLDYEVRSRDRPLIDRDVVTGEWGLPEQITQSTRGQIPENRQTLVQRVQDELVRRAIARGCDRSTVKRVFGISKRTTWNRQYRAQAYDFPLDAFERGESSGSTATRSTGDGNAETSTESETPTSPGSADDGQQRLQSIAGSDAAEERDETGTDDDEGLGKTEVWPPAAEADSESEDPFAGMRSGPSPSDDAATPSGSQE